MCNNYSMFFVSLIKIRKQWFETNYWRKSLNHKKKTVKKKERQKLPNKYKKGKKMAVVSPTYQW